MKVYTASLGVREAAQLNVERLPKRDKLLMYLAENYRVVGHAYCNFAFITI